MKTVLDTPFASLEEEIAFLKAEIGMCEERLLGRRKEIDALDRETIGIQVLREYGEHDSSVVLKKKYMLGAREEKETLHHIETARHAVDELMHFLEKRGVRNTLSIIEKIGDQKLSHTMYRKILRHVQEA